MRTLDPYRRLQKNVLSALVICLLFVNGLNAGGACKRGCPASDRGKFHYQPGSKYVYNFESIMTISLTSSNDETAVKVQGNADVYVQDNCAYTLSLENVDITQAKDGAVIKKKFMDGLNYPVQFTLSNGELESQICTDPADTDYSVNLKRAIISMLQVSNKPYETDVYGVCPTTVTLSTNGDTEIVTKIRNLNACKYRETLSNGFVSGIFNEKAGIKSTPLLASDYSQNTEIVRGVIDRVQAVEEYNFVPLSNAQGGVRAKVKTTLKRMKTAQGAPPNFNGQQQSIIFKNPRPVPIENYNTLKEVLAATVENVKEFVGPETVQKLADLIRLLRSSNQQTIDNLFRDTESGKVHPKKDLARRIFLDALFRAGTDETVASIIKAYNENKFNDLEKRLAFLSFNLVESAEEKSLQAINELLDKKPPNEAYLSIGHLISKYCSQHACDRNPTIQTIANKFITKLNNCQAQTQKQEDTIINVLKGIRNSNVLANYNVDRLVHCTSEKYSSRVRVSALQALTKAACVDKTQNTALHLLKNLNEDSEIRIEAYLTAVACPSATVANQIAELINNEPVHQVGTFISTHLRGIRDSTDAYRETARQHFKNIRITKRFPVDPRRYSMNQEVSYALESLGLGASVDYSLIYSQKGFLPRSYRVNVTAEVFGHDFNILDLNARQENLELFFEHYFGPKGFFNERTHDYSARSKRSIRQEVNTLAKRLKPYGNFVENDLTFDYSVKMFGNELIFLSMGDEIPTHSDTLYKKLKTAAQDLNNKLKSFELDYGSHSAVFDTELIYPTSIGFPIELSAQALGVGRFKLATNIDLHAIKSDMKNSQMRVKFVPSINVAVSGTLKVDTQVLTAGLKVEASMHTSTGADFNLKIFNNGNDFNLMVDFPMERQKIIDYSNEVNFILQEPSKQSVIAPLKGTKGNTNKFTERCFDQLSLFGVTVCTVLSQSISDSKSHSFLLGHNKFSVDVQTERRINVAGSHKGESGKQIWELSYDTPGSKVNHATTVKFELGTSSKFYGRASFNHLEHSLAIEAGINNNQNEFVAYGQYEHNKDTYLTKVGFTKNGNEYRPKILIQTKDKTADDIAGYKADGIIRAEQNGNGKKYNFENLRVLPPAASGHPITLNGWVNIADGIYGMDLKANTHDNDYTIQGTVSYAAGDYAVSGTILNSARPDANGHLSVAVQHSAGHVKTDFAVKHGPNLKHSYELHNEFHFEPEKDQPKFLRFKNNFQASDLPASLTFNGEYSRNVFNYDLSGSLRNAKLGSSLKFVRNAKANGDYDADFSATLNKYNAKLKAKRMIQDGNNILDNSLTTSWGTSATLKGKISQKISPTDVHAELEGTLKLTDKEEQLSWTFMVNATPKNGQSNLKVLRGQVEVLGFVTNYNRGENANGRFELNIKDLIVSKGDLKTKSGTGDASLLINLKKLNKKIKAESHFTIAAPTYDVQTTVYYDFEKDNNKKVVLISKNNVQERRLDSKNALEVGGEKYMFDVNGHHIGGFLEGELDGKFTFTLPDGHQISGDLERKMERKGENTNGYTKINLAEKATDNRQRSVHMDAKFLTMNVKMKHFDIHHKFIYSDFEGKSAEFEADVKHLPHGHFKMAEGKMSLKGNLIEHPFDFAINVDEYCKEHAVFRASGQYHSVLQGNLNGNYHIGSNTEPTKYEIQMNLNSHNSGIKSFKMESKGSLLRPNIEGATYEGNIHFLEEVDDWKVQFDANGKGNRNHGSWSAHYDIPKATPGSIEGSYVQDEQDDTSKYQYNLIAKYDQGKIVKMNIDTNMVRDKSISFDYQLQTPNEDARNIKLSFKGKRSDENTFTGNTQMVHNDKTYGLNTVLAVSDQKKVVDITLSYPGRTSTISGGVERFGERMGKSYLKVENLGDFSFDGAAEANYESLGDFYLKVDANSQKLRLDHFHMKINSAPKGKGIEFKVTNSNKNILSGVAMYTESQEKGKHIVEGQGTLKLYDTDSQANFKLVRQKYEMSHDGEAGFSYTFNGVFGPHNIISELKVTTKNFNLRLASCQEKKQCTNFEIRSVTVIQESNIQHKLMVLIDLREHGFPHEFELQSKTSRTGLTFDHELEMTLIANEDKIYKFQFYIKPNKIGAQMNLPKREIVLESVYKVPEKIFGQYETSISLYPDKKGKPRDKSVIGFIGTLNHIENVAVNAQGEVKFAHPKLSPLKISGAMDINIQQQKANSRIELDIFKTPKQKIEAIVEYQNTAPSGKGANITTEARIRSEGFNFEYGFSGHTAVSFERREISVGGSVVSANSDLRLGTYMYGSQDKFELLVTGFNEEIVHALGTINKQNSDLKSTFKFLGTTPVELNAYAHGINSAGFALKRGNLYNLEGKIQSGQEASLVMHGAGKNLYTARVALDAGHFLSTQYNVNHDDIKSFMETVSDEMKKDTERARNEIEQRFSKFRDHYKSQITSLSNGVADFSGIRENYESNIKSIISELESDESLKGIIDFYKRLFEAFYKIMKTITDGVTETYKKINSAVKDICSKVVEVMKEKVLPLLQKIMKNVNSLFGEIYTSAVKLIGNVVERVSKVLKTFEPDFNRIGKAFAEFYKSFSGASTKFFEVLKKELDDIVNLVKEFIETLPGWEDIKKRISTQFGDFKGIKQAASVLSEMLAQVEDFLPTAEAKEFFRNLHSYINSKVQQLKVDDVEQLQRIYLSFMKAIRSYIRTGDPTSALLFPFAMNFDALKQIPLWTSFKFSVFNYIRNERLPNLSELWLNRPPQNAFLPFELQGHIADGEHIFTFDGRHMTFPGTCSYVLAQDIMNNNFSVIANLQGGKMQSITLMDEHNMIEIGPNAVPQLNGKPSEYPIHHMDIHAWRRYYTVSLLTEYGVYVMCSLDLRICHVSVNGFYSGKTRGILGNGNGEPYDDFTLPSGKITDNYAEFGNAYALKQCTPVAQEDHSHHTKSSICSELFDTDSSLALAYLMIDPTNYVEACNHAVGKASDKHDAACNIALAYASAGRTQKLPVSMPTQCLKCKGHAIGEEFETKTPQKKADIVFVVDVDSSIELVQGIMTDIRAQLKQRDMGDIQTILMVYGNELRYPQIYTTDSKLDFSGKIGQLNLGGPKYKDRVKTGLQEIPNELLDNIEEKIVKIISPSDAQAFNMAIDYPFRSDANKAIIVVRSDQLNYENVAKLASATLTNEHVKRSGILLHLIGPVKDFQLAGKANQQGNVVGFNDKHVVMLGDAKKRSNFGSTELRNYVRYTGDMGVDFVQRDGGYVFPLQNYRDMKGVKEKKQYVAAVANALADQISRTEMVSKCVCRVAYGLLAEESCKEKSSNLLPPVQKKPGARG